MGITTGNGDHGTTSFQGKSYAKEDILFELLGTIDELTSWLVFLRATSKEKHWELLVDDLSVLASYVTGYCACFESDRIQKLDQRIQATSVDFAFRYPYDSVFQAYVNLTRTVARRLERVYCGYAKQQEGDVTVYAYLNRLSDYLFTFM